MPEFPNLDALNDWLEQRCMEMWHDIPHGGQPGSIADVWADEQATLMPLPCAFDGFVEHTKRVWFCRKFVAELSVGLRWT